MIQAILIALAILVTIASFLLEFFGRNEIARYIYYSVGILVIIAMNIIGVADYAGEKDYNPLFLTLLALGALYISICIGGHLLGIRRSKKKKKRRKKWLA